MPHVQVSVKAVSMDLPRAKPAVTHLASTNALRCRPAIINTNFYLHSDLSHPSWKTQGLYYQIMTNKTPRHPWLLLHNAKCWSWAGLVTWCPSRPHTGTCIYVDVLLHSIHYRIMHLCTTCSPPEPEHSMITYICQCYVNIYTLTFNATVTSDAYI